MKYTDFAKQDHSHPTAFALADLGAQFMKQALNVTPLDIGAGGSCVDEVKRTLVFTLHREMVLLFGTLYKTSPPRALREWLQSHPAGG